MGVNIEDIFRTNDMKGSQTVSNEEDNNYFDLSSQTSTTSSITNIISKFSLESNSFDSDKLPMTLRFVLQIFLLVIFLVLATSTVSLVLVQSNFADANAGI